MPRTSFRLRMFSYYPQSGIQEQAKWVKMRYIHLHKWVFQNYVHTGKIANNYTKIYINDIKIYVESRKLHKQPIMQMKINVRYYSSLQVSSPGWGWGKKFTLSSLTPTLKAHMKDRGTYP